MEEVEEARGTGTDMDTAAGTVAGDTDVTDVIDTDVVDATADTTVGAPAEETAQA